MTSEHLFAAMMAIGLFGCGMKDEVPVDGFGLTSIDLRLDTEDVSRLNTTVFDKVDVPGVVTIGTATQKVEVEYAGKTSIDALKKNIDVKFKGSGYKGMKEVRLSATTSDPTSLRSFLGYHVFSLAGLPTPQLEPVAVYLNGTYLGLYTMIEMVDEAFFSRRDVDIATLFKGRHSDRTLDMTLLGSLPTAYSAEVDPPRWGELERFIRFVNGPDVADREVLAKHLDLESYYAYVSAAVLLNHWDGFDNNYQLYRAVGDSAFSLAPWDLDATLQEHKDVSAMGEGRLAEIILGVPSYAAEFDSVAAALRQRVESEDLNGFLAGLVDEMRQAYGEDRILASRGLSLDDEASDLVRRLRHRLGSSR